MEGVSGMSGVRSADQSRGGRGSLVGRRSSVSSSSARCASCAIDHPSARAMPSTTSHVGLAVPASIPRIVVWSSPAPSASASWVSSLSRRRKPRARLAVGYLDRLGERDELREPFSRVPNAPVDARASVRYSISRSRSAGVVPRARAIRRSVCVVASARAFSSSLRNDRSTPLRWATLTCESPVASRDARRLRAS